jgi:hypothetical protein
MPKHKPDLSRTLLQAPSRTLGGRLTEGGRSPTEVSHTQHLGLETPERTSGQHTATIRLLDELA